MGGGQKSHVEAWQCGATHNVSFGYVQGMAGEDLYYYEVFSGTLMGHMDAPSFVGDCETGVLTKTIRRVKKEITSYTAGHKLTGRQSNKLIHLQHV